MFRIDHSLDACLNDEFGTFDAGRGSDIEGGTVAGVVGTCQFGDGVGLGMKHVGLGHVAVVLADIFKTGRGAIVAIGDDGFVLDDKCSHLSAFTVGVLSPNSCHAYITAIEAILFQFLFCHFLCE